MDLEDYNVVQQGCISCKLTLITHYLKIENDIKLNVSIYNFLNWISGMPLFLYYVQTLQTHFPWTNDKAILVNGKLYNNLKIVNKVEKIRFKVS